MSETPTPPLSERHEMFAQEFMTNVWNSIELSKNKLSAYEICGILSNVIGKIEFDMNVRAAQEQLKAMRNNNKPSGIIDNNGFPVE